MYWRIILIVILFYIVKNAKGDTFDVKPYRTIYEQLFNRDTSNLKIYFVEYKKSTDLGICKRRILGNNVITINLESWQKLNSVQREIIILHELAHCDAYKEHRNVKFNGYQLSIMNSSLINYKHYKKFRNEYLYELKTGNIWKLIKRIESEKK